MNNRSRIRRKQHPRQGPAKRSLGKAIVMAVACIAVLAAGVFLAARQHFAAMDLGMKNSKLRSQIDQLEGEKRRLVLAREIASSPGELKKAARKSGLIERREATVELASVKSKTKSKAVPTATGRADERPVVIKTSLVVPTKRSELAADRKLPATVASIR